MIHFTCDMCGKALLADEDVRYVVKIEVYAGYDPMEVTSGDLAKDHEKEMQDLLKQMAGQDAQALEEQVYKVFRFDLCQACRDKYLEDPLARGARSRPRFGEN